MKKQIVVSVALTALIPALNASATSQDKPQVPEVKNELRGRTVPVVRDPSSYSDRDVYLSRRATEALRSDGNLSPEARSAIVRTDRGRVTVQGNVRSPAERERVVHIVEDVAGVGNVDNMLIVLPAE